MSGSNTRKKRHPPTRSKGDWAPAFLASLRETANVRLSCQAAGVERMHVYDYRDSNSEFALAWKRAMDDAIDKLEAIAISRAAKTSDTLLIFLLKSHRPEVYRETWRHEHAGVKGAPIETKETGITFERFASAFAAFSQRNHKRGMAHSGGNGSGESVHTDKPNREASVLPDGSGG